MKTEVRWLLYFCLEYDLLSDKQVQGMLSNLPETTNIHECAKMLVSSGWVKDKEFLESAINAAVENVEKGFAPPGEEETAPRVADGELSTKLAETESTQSKGQTDFSQFSDLNDEDLLEVITDLFAQCKTIGASDLHITGGARVRIRRHRRISYLSKQPIDDSLARSRNW